MLFIRNGIIYRASVECFLGCCLSEMVSHCCVFCVMCKNGAIIVLCGLSERNWVKLLSCVFSGLLSEIMSVWA